MRISSYIIPYLPSFTVWPSTVTNRPCPMAQCKNLVFITPDKSQSDFSYLTIKDWTLNWERMCWMDSSNSWSLDLHEDGG